MNQKVLSANAYNAFPPQDFGKIIFVFPPKSQWLLINQPTFFFFTSYGGGIVIIYLKNLWFFWLMETHEHPGAIVDQRRKMIKMKKIFYCEGGHTLEEVA